jgi:hypothetical protein
MADQPPPPVYRVFRTRDLVRLVLLLTMMGLVVFGMVRLGNPKTWQWVRNLEKRPATPEPTQPVAPRPPPPLDLELESRLRFLALQFAVPSTPFVNPASFDLSYLCILQLEHVPLPRRPDPVARADRSSLAPELNTLRGAAQRQGFLSAPKGERNNFFFQHARQDEDARNHLIALAQAQTDRQIAADGRSDIRYSALMQRPEDYLGEVITVEGELLWLTIFEVPPVDPQLPQFVYQGLIEAGDRNKVYWVLFIDLPPGLPPEKEWKSVYLRGVKFSGYFHKVVGHAAPPDPRDPSRTKDQMVYTPVLIGKVVTVPPAHPGTDWRNVLLTIVVVFGIALVVGTLALWLYYRSERPYEAKIAQLRARTKSGILDGDAETPANGPPVDPFKNLDEPAAEPKPQPAPGSAAPGTPRASP